MKMSAINFGEKFNPSIFSTLDLIHFLEISVRSGVFEARGRELSSWVMYKKVNELAATTLTSLLAEKMLEMHYTAVKTGEYFNKVALSMQSQH